MKRLVGNIANIYVAFSILVALSALIYFGNFTEDGDLLTFKSPIKPSYYYLLTYGVASVILYLTNARANWRSSYLFLSFFVLSAALHFAWMPFVGNDPAIDRTLILRMNNAVMSICFIIILLQADNVKTIVTLARIVVWATCLINIFSILFSKHLNIQMNVGFTRAAGLYWDPNVCAAMMALALPLICWNTKIAFRLINYAVVAVGIFFTFSRGGYLLCALAIVLDLVFQPGTARNTLMKYARNIASVLAVGSIVLVLLQAYYADVIEAMRPYVNADTFARMSGGDQGSGQERRMLATMGWQKFAESPIIGQGFGITRIGEFYLSVHNMFLLMLAEFGLFGFALYSLFLYAVYRIRSNFGIVLFVLIIVTSFLTHTLFELVYYTLLILLYWRVGHLLAPAHAQAPPSTLKVLRTKFLRFTTGNHRPVQAKWTRTKPRPVVKPVRRPPPGGSPPRKPRTRMAHV